MILVTGGAGYIGSHFVLACRDAGRDVVVLDDLSTGTPEALAAGVPLIVGDIADTALLSRIQRMYGISSVVHFAAKISVSESMRNPALYFEVNAAKTERLIRFCAAAGIADVVFSSTAAVYGIPRTAVVDETAATRPISPYGQSKLRAEDALRRASDRHGLRHVVLRYFNVAGADPLGRTGARATEATHLLGRICEVALGRRGWIDVFGTNYDTPDGTCIRDFIHVSDLARVHLAALDHLAGGGDSVTLNCGYGRGTSVSEAIDAMSAVAGRSIARRPRPRRDGDIPVIVADTARLRGRLDWTPRHDDILEIGRTALAFERRRVGEMVAGRPTLLRA